MPINPVTGEITVFRVRDRHHASFPGEGPFGPSVTEPNRVLSIHELLQRYGADRLTAGAPPGVFNGDIPVPDFNTMDRVDKAQYAMDIGDFVASERGRIIVAQEEELSTKKAAKAAVVPPKEDFTSPSDDVVTE